MLSSELLCEMLRQSSASSYDKNVLMLILCDSKERTEGGVDYKLKNGEFVCYIVESDDWMPF